MKIFKCTFFLFALAFSYNVLCMHEKRRSREKEVLFFESVVDRSEGGGFTISDRPIKDRKMSATRCKNPGCTFESDSSEELKKHQGECILNPFFLLLGEKLPVPDEKSSSKLDEFVVNFQKFSQKLGLNMISMSVFSRLLGSIQDEHKKRQLILDELSSHITSTKVDLFHCPLCSETSIEKDFIERHLDVHFSSTQEKH